MKGELKFDCGEKSYTLLLSINALCEIEERAGAGINQIASAMENPESLRIGMARTVFWAALTEHHPDITEKEAGKIMTDLGLERATELLRKVFLQAFPDAEDNADPPKPAEDGTGKTSAGTG